MPSVLNVAAYVVEKCGPITTMKLQKIVYYCQAWSLAWDGVPLFEEDFQAWANGPVCPKLFYLHRGCFKADLNMFKDYLDASVFSPEQIETMNAVIHDLKDKSPQWLSELTHSERPWKEARRGYAPGDFCDVVIDKETMLDYYGGLE